MIYLTSFISCGLLVVIVGQIAVASEDTQNVQLKGYGVNLEIFRISTTQVILHIFVVITLCLAIYACSWCQKGTKPPTAEESNAQKNNELSLTIDIYEEINAAPHDTDKALNQSGSFSKGKFKPTSVSSADDLQKSVFSIKGKKNSYSITTPRTVSSSQSSGIYVQRIEHLRTKLVARFSSTSSGDYSKLNAEDNSDDIEMGSMPNNEDRSKGYPNIPTIVIEFVE